MLLQSLILLFFFISAGFAGTVEDGGVKWTYDDAYSLQTLTGKSFVEKGIPQGTVIYKGYFSSEIPDTVIFPANMKGVTFVNCWLDNIVIPAGNTLVNCSTVTYQAQNDLRDWKLSDDTRQPIKVLSEDYWKAQGISVDPRDIPALPIDSVDKIIKKP